MAWRTADGGGTWLEQKLGTQDLLEVFFVDQARGWITTYGGPAFQTVDGGATWTLLEDPYRSFSFVNYLRGWALQGSAVSLTVDGGTTWSQVWDGNDPWGSKTSYRKIAFTDSARGYAVMKRDQSFFRTRDAGRTWDELFTAGWPMCVWFTDSLNAWAAGGKNLDFGAVYRTSDGGRRWRQYGASAVGELPDGWYLDIYFANADTGWLCGEGRPLLATFDGGKTWAEKGRGIVSPERICFRTSRHGGVFSWNTVFLTWDAGNTWTESIVDPDRLHLYGLGFSDSADIWAVGESAFVFNSVPPCVGKLFHSADGGGTWSIAYRVVGLRLRDVCFVDKQKGWAVGDSGFIVRTEDGGGHWSVQASPTRAALNRMRFADGRNGWVVGAEGVILRTADGGDNWSIEAGPGGYDLRQLCVLDSRHAWTVSDWGGVFGYTEGSNHARRDRPPTTPTGSGATPRLQLSIGPSMGLGRNAALLFSLQGRRVWGHGAPSRSVARAGVYVLPPASLPTRDGPSRR